MHLHRLNVYTGIIIVGASELILFGGLEAIFSTKGQIFVSGEYCVGMTSR
jgi:hypothetical protein